MISIIIPVFNEQKVLDGFIQQLKLSNQEFEIIFVDGGSTDQTVQLISKNNYNVFHSKKGRAIQMNHGAKNSCGDFLLFLHSDVVLPERFNQILTNLERNRIALANFKLAFDYNHWFLKLNSYFSYSSATPFQFGDQGLWVEKHLFTTIGGFNEEMEIIEDQDIVKRSKHYTDLKKIDAVITVSARKYRKYGAFKLQFVYFYIYILYRMGKSQQVLKKEMESLLWRNLTSN